MSVLTMMSTVRSHMAVASRVPWMRSFQTSTARPVGEVHTTAQPNYHLERLTGEIVSASYCHGYTEADVQAHVKTEAARRLLSFSSANAATRQHAIIKRTVAQVQRHPSDTGSTEVQVAAMTSRIRALSDHLVAHRHDYPTKRALHLIINTRRKFMRYLKHSSLEKYVAMLKTLGLRPLATDIVESAVQPMVKRSAKTRDKQRRK
jgi:small subunit ribosomal protein S15